MQDLDIYSYVSLFYPPRLLNPGSFFSMAKIRRGMGDIKGAKFKEALTLKDVQVPLLLLYDPEHKCLLKFHTHMPAYLTLSQYTLFPA